MNTYDGFNLRRSVTAAFASFFAVTASILLSATCLVDTSAMPGAGEQAQGYSIITPQA